MEGPQSYWGSLRGGRGPSPTLSLACLTGCCEEEGEELRHSGILLGKKGVRGAGGGGRGEGGCGWLCCWASADTTCLCLDVYFFCWAASAVDGHLRQGRRQAKDPVAARGPCCWEEARGPPLWCRETKEPKCFLPAFVLECVCVWGESCVFLGPLGEPR